MFKNKKAKGGWGAIFAGGAAVIALIIFAPSLFIGQFFALPTVLGFLKNPIIIILILVAIIMWATKD